MFQTIKSKVTDISNKTDNKISELDQNSNQKWQTLGRLVEDLTNKVETIWFASGVLAHWADACQSNGNFVLIISINNSTV